MNRQTTNLLFALVALGAASVAPPVVRADYGWDGQRHISYQQNRDLFYNYYVGPQPSGTAAGMYVSPLPVPASVGHTYTTYQPFMPHEYLYHHKRSWYNHNPGAGWTRTKVRYSALGAWFQQSPIHISNLSTVPLDD